MTQFIVNKRTSISLLALLAAGATDRWWEYRYSSVRGFVLISQQILRANIRRKAWPTVGRIIIFNSGLKWFFLVTSRVSVLCRLKCPVEGVITITARRSVAERALQKLEICFKCTWQIYSLICLMESTLSVGFRNRIGLGPVHTYPDIFESATFSFRIRLPSTRIRRIRQRIRKKIKTLSKVEKKISATNPITCGRVNPDIFLSDDIKSVSSLSPNNREF